MLKTNIGEIHLGHRWLEILPVNANISLLTGLENYVEQTEDTASGKNNRLRYDWTRSVLRHLSKGTVYFITRVSIIQINRTKQQVIDTNRQSYSGELLINKYVFTTIR